MIFPSDKDYQQAKQIMLGKAHMKAEFQPLADWMGVAYDVQPVNIIYDIVEGKRPRLQICFEFQREASIFTDSNTAMYDPIKQTAIADKFEETLRQQGLLHKKGILDFLKSSICPKYQTDNLWVTFNAVEPIAMNEANESIPHDEITALQNDIGNETIWQIVRSARYVTFFLYTDEQVKENESSAARREWTYKYFDLLDKYNEFGYFKREFFSVFLDSKENFDKNYQSNWYYYFK